MPLACPMKLSLGGGTQRCLNCQLCERWDFLPFFLSQVRRLAERTRRLFRNGSIPTAFPARVRVLEPRRLRRVNTVDRRGTGSSVRDAVLSSRRRHVPHVASRSSLRTGARYSGARRPGICDPLWCPEFRCASLSTAALSSGGRCCWRRPPRHAGWKPHARVGKCRWYFLTGPATVHSACCCRSTLLCWDAGPRSMVFTLPT